MNYGLSATNNGGSVVISSEYKTLVFSERGTFRITSRYIDGEGYGSVTFAKPILTQEPPQIFTCCTGASHSALAIYTRVLGGPGYWTGFNVTSASNGVRPVQNFYMEYVSCKFSDSRSVDEFGLEIYDGSEGVVYTSSDRVVRYSKFTKDWDWRPPLGYGVVGVFHSRVAVDPDDFICISSIDRGNAWFCGRVHYAGLRIVDGGLQSVKILINRSKTYEYLTQFSGPSFSIPVCKFPIERYYNS
ncbi:hypothetical protein [Pseudomonas weihenstephanensis]|nr:hypothetical protein [Pseudomonas weihenstephanensis]